MFLVMLFTLACCVFLFLWASKKKSTSRIVLFAIFFLLFRLVCFAGTVSGNSGPENGKADNVTVQVGETTEGTEPATEPTTAPTTAPTTVPQISFEEIVVVDNSECTIKITELDPDNFWGYTVKVLLENKSPDKTYMFAIRGASVNGIDSDPGFAAEVAPGKKAHKEINFSDNMLEDLGIEFTDIEMIFRVYDSNDWLADHVAFETVHVYPYGPEYATHYVREIKDTDTVLVDNEYITAVITGYEMDDIWGYTANIFLVNKTDSEVMFSTDEDSVNGFMIDPFWATSVLPRSCKFSSISWSESTLEENGITSIEEIEFIFKAYDEDNIFDKYIEQVFTLTP